MTASPLMGIVNCTAWWSPRVIGSHSRRSTSLPLMGIVNHLRNARHRPGADFSLPLMGIVNQSRSAIALTSRSSDSSLPLMGIVNSRGMMIPVMSVNRSLPLMGIVNGQVLPPGGIAVGTDLITPHGDRKLGFESNGFRLPPMETSLPLMGIVNCWVVTSMRDARESAPASLPLMGIVNSTPRLSR